MFKACLLFLCAIGATWLVREFGFGMFVAIAAAVASVLLFSGDVAPERSASPTTGQQVDAPTTMRADF